MLVKALTFVEYPQEEKTIVIPQVVASERGIAQTDNVSALSG